MESDNLYASWVFRLPVFLGVRGHGLERAHVGLVRRLEDGGDLGAAPRRSHCGELGGEGDAADDHEVLRPSHIRRRLPFSPDQVKNSVKIRRRIAHTNHNQIKMHLKSSWVVLLQEK